jgi:hypothetical protein
VPSPPFGRNCAPFPPVSLARKRWRGQPCTTTASSTWDFFGLFAAPQSAGQAAALPARLSGRTAMDE